MTDEVGPDELHRLREEVAQLRGRLDRRARVRRWLALPLLVLGCALVAASAIALYTHATLLDTDRYVRTMAPIAESRAVQRAVAQRLDRAIDDRVNFAALIRGALPERARELAPVLAGALQQAIRARIDAFVASDDFPRLWSDANRRAHTRVVELLVTGETGRLGLQGDTVYLDLGRVVDGVRQALAERGLTRVAGAIPASVDGQVTLLQADGFVKARSAVDALDRLRVVLPLLALLCLIGYVALARPRRRALLHVGIRIALTALLLLVLAGIGRSAYLAEVDRRALSRNAAADIFDALFTSLRTSLRELALAGAAIALLALVLGQAGRIAAAARGGLARLGGGGRLGWVSGHRAALQGVAAGIGAVVLVAWDPLTAWVALIVVAAVAASCLSVGALARIAER